MSAVQVEIADNFADADAAGAGSASSGSSDPPPDAEAREERRRRVNSVEVEVEREITKRKLIESITTVLVVVLYMVFTLVRDRDAGVVVLDPDERDDWDEA